MTFEAGVSLTLLALHTEPVQGGCGQIRYF